MGCPKMIIHQGMQHKTSKAFIWKLGLMPWTMGPEYEGNLHISRVSCEKGPTRHAYAWQIWPFWQNTLDFRAVSLGYE